MLVLGTNASKYGCSSTCKESGIFGRGSTFYCFARWMSWPLYFSYREDEELAEFWSHVILPALDVALPLKAREAGRPPLPGGETARLNRREFSAFVGAMRETIDRGPGHRWDHVTTVCFKVGQKQEPLDPDLDRFFDQTLGRSLECFSLEGIDSMFWSTGCNLKVPETQEGERDRLASFWTKSFLERELENAPRRKSWTYKLLGTDSLVSAQSKGECPDSFARYGRRLAVVAEERGATFEIETWQFYSTWVYLFKGSKGDEYPCDPTDSRWKSKSSTVDWLRRWLGNDGEKKGRNARGELDPLSSAAELMGGSNPGADSPLRVEPTFFLRFAYGADRNSRAETLRLLVQASATFLADTYAERCRDDPEGVQVSIPQRTCLDWMVDQCTLYRNVVSKIEEQVEVSGPAVF